MDYRSHRYKTSGTGIIVTLHAHMIARVRMMREIVWFAWFVVYDVYLNQQTGL